MCIFYNVCVCVCLRADHVFEALLNTPAESQTLEEGEVLEERWIKEVVTRSGMKYRWARLAQEKERENRDASRRYGYHGHAQRVFYQFHVYL